jgi:hypothetical protein
MLNNYNGALRPPVIYCSGGLARLGVRRETPDELLAREMGLVTASGRTSWAQSWTGRPELSRPDQMT